MACGTLWCLLVLAAGWVAEAAQAPAAPAGLRAPAATGSADPAHATPVAPAPAAIPIAEVTARATEVAGYLSGLYNRFLPSGEIEAIRRDLPDADSRLAAELQRSLTVLGAHPTLEMLQDEQQEWQKNQAGIADWIRVLTERATALQTTIGKLEALQTSWQQTLDGARSGKAPQTIIDQIRGLLEAIEAAKLALQSQSSAVLELQGRVAVQADRCGTALSQISRAQQAAVNRIAGRERLPIWSADLWRQARVEGSTRFHDIVGGPWQDFRRYLGQPFHGLPVHLALFGVIGALFLLMRRGTRQWPAGQASPAVAVVTDHPWTAAVIIAILLATAPVFPTPPPPTVRNALSVAAVAAMIRLMKPVAARQMVPALYALGLLFAVDTVRHALGEATFIDQLAVVLEAFAGMAVILAVRLHGGLEAAAALPTGAAARARRAGSVLILGILAAGLVAGILGYMRAARLLVSGVLIGAALALTLVSMVRILRAVVAFLLRVRPLRLLRMVSHHRELLERRSHRVLAWIATFTWFVRVLDYVGMFQPTVATAEAVLGARLARGTISLSIGDVLSFVVTVWAAFLFSAFVRFVLQEDVYPRKKVPEGLAYAASRLLHYLILTVGFVLGLGLLGVDLTKVTVLLSAFGVGIGFGLQSVVNNFVSGLVLLFERPIHLGDTVELGNLAGRVRRIGIRASVVGTWQGAEIIVPNSQLISEKVTNWTLSDRLRRIELALGVNYGADPGQVIETLNSVAAANPKVLAYPASRTLLVGFGDSAVNFELQAWTDQLADWVLIRSELAVAAYGALREAGFSFPFPQREVRMLDDKAGGCLRCEPPPDGRKRTTSAGTEGGRQ